MEPLKNRYNRESVALFAKSLRHEKFNTSKFLKDILKTLESLEMKARVDLISESLNQNFDLNYKRKILFITSKLDEISKIDPFLIWPLTNYVALFGLDELENSALAMAEMTKRFSSEFVIRYFIQKYESQMYTDYLNLWVSSKCEHVRRLVSEGSRPNLPWGIKVNYINSNLKRNIKLLNKLKNDKSLYVRKSVANHFNDISRIDPELMIKSLESWSNPTQDQKWIIKHASRSLLKMGNTSALQLNGYDVDPDVDLLNKKISKKKIKEGDSFEITFELSNRSEKELRLSVDYVIHYPKKNGSLSAKTFKLKDIILKDKLVLSKKISFKKVSTRTHYKGEHFIEIKISDKIVKFLSFHLI